MKSTTVELPNIEGAEAAAGWAGGHALVVEQPKKKCRFVNLPAPGRAGIDRLGMPMSVFRRRPRLRRPISGQ